MPRNIAKYLEEIGIINAIGDPLSIQNTDFKVIYQNKRHREIVGDCIGQYCYKAYQEKSTVCEGCHIAMCFSDGMIHTVERTRTTDKGTMFYENTASPLKDPAGKIIAGIEVIRDITKRKLAEKDLQKIKNELEINIKERTLGLAEANEALLNEVKERKMIEDNLRFTEKELIKSLKELKETNTALRVLLKNRDQDKTEFERNILSNVKHLIFPYLSKLKKNNKNDDELALLSIIESNLAEIVYPFSSKLSAGHIDLTPRELQIADLIKDGKQDKEITDILAISLDTVRTHRKNIRKKLGIYSKRINLRSHLLSKINNR
jgi:DNA-binding CsgD family transcriptional regulator